jgi:hypothetical protein
MEAELLLRPPISGQYEEHNFAVSGNTVWVKFFDEEWVEWCGVFSLGWCSGSSVCRVPEKKEFLVLAGGQGYFIDPNKRIINSKTKSNNIESVIYNNAIGWFVASDGLSVGILRGEKIHWLTDRISLDGITFTKSEGVVVEGVLNDLSDDGGPFKLNVETGKIDAPWVFYQNFK